MIRDSNKMKYNPFFSFFFCLDDADTKNKKMDTNTEKLKGTLIKTKITEGYDLVSEPSSDTT
jgi:hypothetical protein